MERYHWSKITAFGGAAATALAAAIAACVTDGVDTIICSTGLECAPNWVCTEAGDRCYPKGCGDGITDRRNGERCDDANNKDGDGCSDYCLVLDACGNNIIDPGEACDDGNQVSGDECSDDCQEEMCLNSIVDLNEECDEGTETATCNDNCKIPRCGDLNPNPFFTNPLTGLREVCDKGANTADCDADCSRPECGDGLLNAAANEDCDDGNTENSDGCVDKCMPARCGDGHIWQGVEECGEEEIRLDPIDRADCDADCTRPVCGDGHVNELAGEECDDGNSITLDGCPSGPEGTCKLARCGDGFLHLGVEQCDEGNNVDTDDCPDGSRGTCQPARCGDGFVHAGFEECDDEGNQSNNDDCPNGPGGTCRPARCGDGHIKNTGAVPEECDDGNGLTIDDCPDGPNGTCKPARCGDGLINLNDEQCDTAGDGMTCDADCTPPRCGDGHWNSAAGEECETNDDCGAGHRCNLDGPIACTCT